MTQYRLEPLVGDRVALSQRYYAAGVTRWRVLGPVLLVDDQGGPAVIVVVRRRYWKQDLALTIRREKLTGLELWRAARRRLLR